MNNNKQQQAEEILNSLNGMQQAEAPAFFATRLRARMERELLQEQKQWFPVKRPVLLITVLSLFLIVNLFVLKQQHGNTAPAKQAAASLQGFASEYGLGNSPAY